MRTVVRRLHLLVVDDDPTIRDCVARVLWRQGHHVETFANGVELVDYLATWILRVASPPARKLLPIDALITDVRMPGFDGLGIVQGLRAKGWALPVVIMSAFGDRALRERVDRLEAVRFVSKPFEPTDLLRILDEMLAP